MRSTIREQAGDIARDEKGKMVVVLSEKSVETYGDQLIEAGFGVEQYDAAVASGLSAFDPTLFDQLKPGALDGKVVVGTIMRGGKNWDIAGLQVVSDGLDGKVTNLQGDYRGYRPGEKGAIVACSPEIHALMLGAIASRR